MNKAAESEKPFLIQIWPSIIVPLLTLGGYGLGVAYEVGYATTYGIPVSFISISLPTTLIAIGAFIPLLGLFMIFLHYLNVVVYQLEPCIKGRIFGNIPIALIASVVLSSYSGTKRIEVSCLLLIWWIGVIVFQFVYPLCFHRDEPSYLNRIKQYDKDMTHHSLQKPNPGFEFLSRLGMVPAQIIYLVVLSAFLGLLAGRIRAVWQRTYLMQSKSSVVVRKYGDILVCADVDIPSKRVKPELRFLNINQSTTTFRLENIGPLIPPEL